MMFVAKALLIASVLIVSSAQAAIAGSSLQTGQAFEVKPGAKGTVMIFMSAKCPCSNSHVGTIKNIAEEFKEFAFVAIHSNSDETPEFARSYFENVRLPFPVIQDSDSKLADKYKAVRTPHAFLLGPDDKILYKGGITDCTDDPENSKKQYLRSALNDVRAGGVVKISEARPLGCQISRN